MFGRKFELKNFKSGRGHILGHLEVVDLWIRTPLLLNKLGPQKQKGLDYSEPDERSYGVERKNLSLMRPITKSLICFGANGSTPTRGSSFNYFNKTR